MSSPQSDSEDSVYISSVTLNVREELGGPVDHIILQTKTGTFKKELLIQVSPGHKHKEVFDPAFELSPRDRLSVSIQHLAQWKGTRTSSITIGPSEVVTEAQDDGQGNQISLFKLHENIEVAIGVSPYSAASENSHTQLTPTTSEILRVCPRFRILIIGNLGVGKSSLIRNVFGVRDVDVSAASRGRADIDREYIGPENELFVVHNSPGLEGNNLEKVKHFIDGRRRLMDLRDRLHAVWVCLAVPYTKGRLLDAGMEEFVRNRKKILGDIPIVVVLTKLDLLDNALIMDLRREGVQFKSIEEAKPFLEPRRYMFLKEYCSQPLLGAAESDIPQVAVSTRSGYRLEPTISELVKTTTSEIERYIKADSSYTAATKPQSVERNAPLYTAEMARWASIEAKVDLAIAIGKKRYWTNLGAFSGFSAEKVKEYLLVLHQDIIRAWSFHDPEQVLQGDGLKIALLDTSDLGVDDIPDALAVL